MPEKATMAEPARPVSFQPKSSGLISGRSCTPSENPVGGAIFVAAQTQKNVFLFFGGAAADEGPSALRVKRSGRAAEKQNWMVGAFFYKYGTPSGVRLLRKRAS